MNNSMRRIVKIFLIKKLLSTEALNLTMNKNDSEFRMIYDCSAKLIDGSNCF